MLTFSIRIATLAIVSGFFVANAQKPEKFIVSNDTAGATAGWFNPIDFSSGFLSVDQVTSPLTNGPATLMNLNLTPRPGFFIVVSCLAPATAVSSKTFNSVSFHLTDLATCDGGLFQVALVLDCTSGPMCVELPLPHLSLSVNWTKLGVRTYQRSGTESQVTQDFSGNMISSTETSGIKTMNDAPFVGDLSGVPFAGLGLITFSKGVTITFTKSMTH